MLYTETLNKCTSFVRFNHALWMAININPIANQFMNLTGLIIFIVYLTRPPESQIQKHVN